MWRRLSALAGKGRSNFVSSSTATYDEHAKILRAILARRADPAKLLLRSHIEASKTDVRKITIHKLHSARPAAGEL